MVGGAGEVLCWPSGPPVPENAVPRAVAGLGKAVSVAAGFENDCALLASGEVSCWWWKAPTPVKVEALAGVKSLGLRGVRGCALLQNGEVWCFDPNTRIVDWKPSARNIETLVVGVDYACGITRSRTVSCWFTTEDIAEAPVSGIADVESLTVGIGSACALSRGQVHCWGTDQPVYPDPVEGLKDITAIVGTNGGLHCAILGHRTVSCWRFDSKMVAKPLPGFPI